MGGRREGGVDALAGRLAGWMRPSIDVVDVVAVIGAGIGIGGGGFVSWGGERGGVCGVPWRGVSCTAHCS